MLLPLPSVRNKPTVSQRHCNLRLLMTNSLSPENESAIDSIKLVKVRSNNSCNRFASLPPFGGRTSVRAGFGIAGTAGGQVHMHDANQLLTWSMLALALGTSFG